MELGYGFHWDPYQALVITLPDGTKVTCIVENYCPYVVEEGGVSCPFTGDTSSTSSSSRRLPNGLRDETDQSARVPTETVEGAPNAPSIRDSIKDKNNGSLTADPDDITLAELGQQAETGGTHSTNRDYVKNKADGGNPSRIRR